METLRRLHPRYERDVMAFVQQTRRNPIDSRWTWHAYNKFNCPSCWLCCTTAQAAHFAMCANSRNI